MSHSILFVDDEFSPDTEADLGSYMSYYVLALRDAGFSVELATTVDEAIALRREQSFDLAILDVMMPPGEAFSDEDTMKGIRTGILLAGKLHEADLPIILLSNAGENAELFAEAVKRGVVERVLFKLDVTPGDLVREVNSVATGRKPR